MKSASKILLALYIIVLLWLVVFKFSIDIPAALRDNNTQIINLVPFADYTRSNIAELIYNFIAFIPFGLFLSINLKQSSIRKRLFLIFICSLGVEIFQYIFAMGVADITDVISNTSGGLLGLIVYGLARKRTDEDKLDARIITIGSFMLGLFIVVLCALFALGLRFQKPAPRTRPGVQIIFNGVADGRG